MSKVCIGTYVCNEPVPVYANPDTKELYYNDELSGDYMLVGFDVENIPSYDVVENHAETAAGLPEGFMGVVFDGLNKWLLSEDGQAYRVKADAVDVSEADVIVGYDDTLEYDDVEDDE